MQRSSLRLILLPLLLCLLVLFAACGSDTTSSTSSTQPTHAVSQPTAQPTSQPKPTPTEHSATQGPAILGAPLGTFIAKYGQPNQFSQPSFDEYFFSIYGNNKDDVTVQFTDSSGQQAQSILLDSPTDAGWNESTAIVSCLPFLPSDAIYKRQMMQIKGGVLQDIQRVYVSPSLAKEFSTSDFTDENGNQTTPGTIGMTFAYNLNNTTSFLDCGVQVGLLAI